MQDNEYIHIAASCDDNYAAFANVMMRSAAENTSRPIHCHLLDCGLSSESRRRMAEDLENSGAQLSFYEPDSSLFEGLPTYRYGEAAYHRIALPEYLPTSIERVIYLDSDILVRNDLEALYVTDLQEKPLGAVENMSQGSCRETGLSRHEYFNSGVLLMNLKQWRQQGIHWQVIDYTQSHAHDMRLVDQSALNAVLHGDWFRLPVAWNQQSYIFKTVRRRDDGCSYPIEELLEAARQPAIVHFTGRHKPWKRNCFHPFRKEFQNVMQRVELANGRLEDDSVRMRLRYYLALRRHWKSWRRARFGF